METNKIGGNIVFYLEREVVNGELKIETKSRFLPLELKGNYPKILEGEKLIIQKYQYLMEIILSVGVKMIK